MTQKWYPEKVAVGPEGTPTTYGFMRKVFQPDQPFHYAEFGIYQAKTAENVCRLFPKAVLSLFDFDENIAAARQLLAGYPNTVHYYGNTQKFNDSYNWALMKLIAAHNGAAIFDYCFLDGAHTVAVDALNFFLCDRLLRPGGYMDFDDYGWRLRNSSLDPSRIPEIGHQYTDEQIDAYQVKMIVDDLVKRDPRYTEVVTDKIFQKSAA